MPTIYSTPTVEIDYFMKRKYFYHQTQLNVLEEERFEEYKECLSFVAICLTIIWHASMKDDCIESMIARVC